MILVITGMFGLSLSLACNWPRTAAALGAAAATCLVAGLVSVIA